MILRFDKKHDFNKFYGFGKKNIIYKFGGIFFFLRFWREKRDFAVLTKKHDFSVLAKKLEFAVLAKT